jgi:hypothetical protein
MGVSHSFSFSSLLFMSSIGHGYGFTLSFHVTGHIVMGTVSDFNTHRDTIPVTAVSQYCMNTLSDLDCIIAATF